MTEVYSTFHAKLIIYSFSPSILDLVYAYNNLLPSTSYGKRLGESGQFTSSSVSFYWGMKRKMPELDVHNIFLAEEYKSSFDDIFKRHLLPKDPSFYINVPSQIDPSGNIHKWSNQYRYRNLNIITIALLTLSPLFLSWFNSCTRGQRNTCRIVAN